MTGLRFFAAAYVMVCHVIGPNSPKIVDSGYLGVTFFFVLSGFVLTWSRSTAAGAFAFYRNRFARVWPLTVITMIIAAFLPLAGIISVGTLIQNITLTQAWTDAGAHSFNTVSWSVSCEAFFYACFPLLIRGIDALKSSAQVAAVAAGTILAAAVFSELVQVVSPAHSYYLTYDFPPYRLAEFVVGICLAVVMQRGWRLPATTTARWQTAMGGWLVLLAAVDVVDPLGRAQMALLTLPLVVIAIAWAVGREVERPRWWLASMPMRRLGEWSFALYLTHTFLVRLVDAGLGRSDVGYLPVLYAVPVMVFAVAVAAAAHTFIERPLEIRLRAPRPPLHARSTTTVGSETSSPV